ncbi:MAG: capsular biosynthesis protein [Muribaculaceae bacterium]|nr:capsular biosynthesis protein [Muribaculaceae bacterium]
MWPFKRKVNTLEESGLTNGLVDWHSHILPGVDDGLRTLEDSLEVLRHYEQSGIKEVWLTPHIMEDYPNTTADLLLRFEELNLAWNGKVKLNLASENMLDTLFEERLETRDFLTLGKEGNLLLVETSYFSPPINMEDLLDNVLHAGYYPMLAHPERYRYMSETDYRRLHERGVKFQLDYLSAVGSYGETARRKSEWLLKEGLIDLIGSDIHRLDTFKNMMTVAPKKSATLESLLNVARSGNIYTTSSK